MRNQSCDILIPLIETITYHYEVNLMFLHDFHVLKFPFILSLFFFDFFAIILPTLFWGS